MLELLLPACASYTTGWRAAGEVAVQLIAESNVGARTFEVRSSDSMQQSAAPVNEVRTDNEHHAQPVLKANGQCLNSSILQGIRFAVTDVTLCILSWISLVLKQVIILGYVWLMHEHELIAFAVPPHQKDTDQREHARPTNKPTTSNLEEPITTFAR
jgi:hypothetical protein